MLVFPLEYILRNLNSLNATLHSTTEVTTDGESLLIDNDRITTASSSVKELKDFLMFAYKKFKIHYEWFKRSQLGDPERPHSCSWRGRTKDHCLASGLDDYPRTYPVHPKVCAHLYTCVRWYNI